MAKKVRLHQFLSKTGAFKSKKEIVEAIKNKEITIDGKITTDLHFQLNPNARLVAWKGSQLKYSSERIYLLINKPKGYLCSRLTEDEKSLRKKSIFSLIKEKAKESNVNTMSSKDTGSKDMNSKVKENVKGDILIQKETLRTLFCVGRLDEDTCGLLLITNDGEISTKITNPENKIPKKYHVVLKKVPRYDDIKALEKGANIELEENGVITRYKTLPCKIEVDPKKGKHLSMTLLEGKKREVKRMFETIGSEVVYLERITIGKLKLEELGIAQGEYKLVEKEFIVKKIF